MSNDDGEAADPALVALLRHYAPKDAADRETWRERVSEWPEASPRDLSQWHGDLIAAAWIEQNTGQTYGCYRVTQAGRRVLREQGN